MSLQELSPSLFLCFGCTFMVVMSVAFLALGIVPAAALLWASIKWEQAECEAPLVVWFKGSIAFLGGLTFLTCIHQLAWGPKTIEFGEGDVLEEEHEDEPDEHICLKLLCGGPVVCCCSIVFFFGLVWLTLGATWYSQADPCDADLKSFALVALLFMWLGGPLLGVLFLCLASILANSSLNIIDSLEDKMHHSPSGFAQRGALRKIAERTLRPPKLLACQSDDCKRKARPGSTTCKQCSAAHEHKALLKPYLEEREALLEQQNVLKKKFRAHTLTQTKWQVVWLFGEHDRKLIALAFEAWQRGGVSSDSQLTVGKRASMEPSTIGKQLEALESQIDGLTGIIAEHKVSANRKAGKHVGMQVTFGSPRVRSLALLQQCFDNWHSWSLSERDEKEPDVEQGTSEPPRNSKSRNAKRSAANSPFDMSGIGLSILKPVAQKLLVQAGVPEEVANLIEIDDRILKSFAPLLMSKLSGNDVEPHDVAPLVQICKTMAATAVGQAVTSCQATEEKPLIEQGSHQNNTETCEAILTQLLKKNAAASPPEREAASTTSATSQMDQNANVVQPLAQLALTLAGVPSSLARTADLAGMTSDAHAVISRLLEGKLPTKLDRTVLCTAFNVQDDGSSAPTPPAAGPLACHVETGKRSLGDSPAREALQPLGLALLRKFGLSEAEASKAELSCESVEKVSQVLYKCLIGCEPALHDVVALAMAFNINLDDSCLVARWQAAHMPAGSMAHALATAAPRGTNSDGACAFPHVAMGTAGSMLYTSGTAETRGIISDGMCILPRDPPETAGSMAHAWSTASPRITTLDDACAFPYGTAETTGLMAYAPELRPTSPKGMYARGTNTPRGMNSEGTLLPVHGPANVSLLPRHMPVNQNAETNANACTMLPRYELPRAAPDVSHLAYRRPLPLEELGHAMRVANQELQLGDQI